MEKNIEELEEERERYFIKTVALEEDIKEMKKQIIEIISKYPTKIENPPID